MVLTMMSCNHLLNNLTINLTSLVEHAGVFKTYTSRLEAVFPPIQPRQNCRASCSKLRSQSQELFFGLNIKLAGQAVTCILELKHCTNLKQLPLTGYKPFLLFLHKLLVGGPTMETVHAVCF